MTPLDVNKQPLCVSKLPDMTIDIQDQTILTTNWLWRQDGYQSHDLTCMMSYPSAYHDNHVSFTEGVEYSGFNHSTSKPQDVGWYSYESVLTLRIPPCRGLWSLRTSSHRVFVLAVEPTPRFKIMSEQIWVMLQCDYRRLFSGLEPLMWRG